MVLFKKYWTKLNSWENLLLFMVYVNVCDVNLFILLIASMRWINKTFLHRGASESLLPDCNLLLFRVVSSLILGGQLPWYHENMWWNKYYLTEIGECAWIVCFYHLLLHCSWWWQFVIHLFAQVLVWLWSVEMQCKCEALLIVVVRFIVTEQFYWQICNLYQLK